MSAAKVILGILGGGMKVAGAIGTVGTVATVGEVVAKRAGWMAPQKSLVGEMTGLVLDIAGAPDAGKKKVLAQIGAVTSTAPQLPPASGDAAAEPQYRDVCPQCHTGETISLGDANGSPVRLVQCPDHQELNLGLADYWTRMSNGYVASLGKAAEIGAVNCVKPTVDRFISVAKGGIDLAAYQMAMINYNECVRRNAVEKANADAAAAAAATAAKEKDAAVAEVKAVEAGKRKRLATQRDKIAKMLLDRQSKAYDKKIEELKAQQAAEASAAKQAEVQKQIDALTAAKAESDRTADALREQAKDAQHKAEMDALAAKITEAGTKTGGLDQLMQMMVLMQQMQQRPQEPAQPQQPAQPQYAQPVMVAPDGTVLASPVMYAQPQMLPAAPWSPVSESAEPMFDNSLGFEFAGGPDAPLDPDVATSLGIEGGTNEDASIYFGLLDGGNEDILDELLADGEPSPSVGGCNAFSCSTKS